MGSTAQPFDPDALDAPLAALDELPRGLWLGGLINSLGRTAPRLDALLALRGELLAGRLPILRMAAGQRAGTVARATGRPRPAGAVRAPRRHRRPGAAQHAVAYRPHHRLPRIHGRGCRRAQGGRGLSRRVGTDVARTARDAVRVRRYRRAGQVQPLGSDARPVARRRLAGTGRDTQAARRHAGTSRDGTASAAPGRPTFPTFPTRRTCR